MYDWICLHCRAKLEPVGEATLRCPDDGTLYHKTAGIWRFLDAAQHEDLAGFLARYAAVRRDEGWGSDDAAYYRALPFRDLSGRHPEIWRIRAVSYRVFLRRVLRPAARRAGRLRVLDVGAGNGWLSYRIAEEGHHSVAVDVTTDERDGLAAAVHYPAPPPCVQASFDRLPWADGSFDLVVFNGALHYSRDYAATLREACRVLRTEGRVVVMDTPVYQRATSGRQMLDEMEVRLRERYGTGRAASHEGYLTPGRLRQLADELGLEWRVLRPFYGLRWALLPWKARLLGQRELMRFHLLVARRRSQGVS